MILNHRFCGLTAIVCFLIVLPSCGSNQSETPNLPPQFVTDLEIAVDENSTSIGTALATDPENDSLTFTISGPDATEVAVSRDGNMRFLSPKDFEAPSSADGDNLYEVIVEVSDGESTTSEQFNISIIDQSELYIDTYFPFEEDEVNYAEFNSVESAMAVDEVFSTDSRLWGFKFISDQAYLTTRQDGVFFLHDLVTEQKYSFDVSSKINLYSEGQGGLFNFDLAKISNTSYQIYFAASIVTQQSGYALALFRFELTLGD